MTRSTILLSLRRAAAHGLAGALALSGSVCLVGCGTGEGDALGPAELRQELISAPQLTAISPAIGATAGGTRVTLTGRNFRPSQTVSFGGELGTDVTVLSSMKLTVVLPPRPGTHGRVEVVVRDVSGKVATRGDLFSYYSPTVSFDAPPRFQNSPPDLVPSKALAGDWNGDGRLDAALIGWPANILLNDGAGGFKITGLAMSNPLNAHVADGNGDGKLDLLGCASWGVSTGLSVGDGSFRVVASPVDAVLRDCALGDVNGDGKPDMVALVHHDGGDIWPRQDQASVVTLLNKGDGSFTAMKQFGREFGTYRGVVLADLNRDGRLDLAYAYQYAGSSGIRIGLGGGDGTFVHSRVLMAGSNTLSARDANGDFTAPTTTDTQGAPKCERTMAALMSLPKQSLV